MIGAARSTTQVDAAGPRPPGAQPGIPGNLVLVGNPNVGKSALFKRLTGRHVTISNFPGTTVEIVRARADLAGASAEVYDTPGINDLGQTTEDAAVTRAVLRRDPRAVLVQVADARNLRRALLLTLQLAQLRRPMVLALNMVDELRRSGARIDVRRLESILGVPVVRTVAVDGDGVAALVQALPRARVPAEALAAPPAGGDRAARNQVRLDHVRRILAETWSLHQPPRPRLAVRLGFWAMHPVKGLALLVLVLLAVFWFVGLFGAGTLVELLEVGVFEQRISPLAIVAVDRVLPFPHRHDVARVDWTVTLPVSPVHGVDVTTVTREVVHPGYRLEPGTAPAGLQALARFVHDLLVGPYGLLTMALSYALAIVLPIVTTFFLVFGALEDSGYLPRLSILVNRVFRLMGLSGKAVLPMMLGLGCDTMAVMSTRILETRRERIVTTVLLALAVPCSAQLGVLLAMLARLSLTAALFWVGLMAGIMLVVGALTARLFGSGEGDFIVEVPPLRRPRAGNLLAKTLARLEWYLREVIPLFMLGTFVLFLLDRLGLLAVLTRWGRPLVTGWLGLPAETTGAFLIGFLRRDYGAVFLLDAATGADAVLSPLQILVAMVTITLFMPCIATLFMIAREHGRRVALATSAFIFPFAFLVGGLVHQLGRALGW